MILLHAQRCPCGTRHISFHAFIAGDLWPAWRYLPDLARVALIDECGVIRGDVPADAFTHRELAALQQAEVVMRRPSPLLIASLVESLAKLVPLRWVGGGQVDAAGVAAGIRKGAVLS